MKTNIKILELARQADDSSLSRYRDAISRYGRGALLQSSAIAHLQQANPPANEPSNQFLLKNSPWKGKLVPAEFRIGRASRRSQFISRTYTNEAGARDYMLFVPSTYTGQPLPLIVMLHGCKQDPQDFAIGTRMNELAEENHCLVAYPAQSSGANRSRCWNWFNSANQQRDLGEPAVIAGMTTQIMADYRVDRRQVYIAGLSAGGSMAIIMGHTYPDLYAAVGVHSGLAYGRATNLFSAIFAMRHGAFFGLQPLGRGDEATRSGLAIPTIVFHGDRDKTVHPDNGDQVIAHSVQNEAGVHTEETGFDIFQDKVEDGHAYTQTVYDDGAGNVLAEQWIIHGAGHTWSGGDVAGSFTDARGPDASREMLRFFLSHPHSVSASS
jgi:poly(hydroxyalkanoate) depolymerase family esterase